MSSNRRGGALLAIMWLSAALAAISFGVANTVRSEIERTAAATDGVRAYYLATSGLDRALMYMYLGPAHRLPDGSPRYFDRYMPRLQFAFATGIAEVQIVPENSKLALNAASLADFMRLLVTLGAEPERAQETAAAIIDWRTPAPAGFGPFDQFYMGIVPPFRARHASFEEIEELLLVKGMTPDLYYGAWLPGPEGRLVRRAGLREMVSVYGSVNSFDINTVEPALMLSIGVPPQVVTGIVERRRVAPFRTPAETQPYTDVAGPAGARLRLGGGTIYTVRSTGTLRNANGTLSDIRRSASALVKMLDGSIGDPYHVLRWYEGAQ